MMYLPYSQAKEVGITNVKTLSFLFYRNNEGVYPVKDIIHIDHNYTLREMD